MGIPTDPAGHAPFVGMPGEEEVDVEEGSIIITGRAPWVNVAGPLNPDGTFTAVGVGDVAGRHVIGVQFVGKLSPSGLSGDYSMGVKVVVTQDGKQVTGGFLPTGQAIIFHVEGHRKGTTSPSPAPSAVPLAIDARLKTFIDNFIPARRTNDTTFRVQSLHAAVLNLYGADQCQSFIRQSNADPTYNIQILGVQGPAPWQYVADGISTLVPNVYTLDANETVQGQTQKRELHFGLVGDAVFWFADCGNSLMTPTPTH